MSICAGADVASGTTYFSGGITGSRNKCTHIRSHGQTHDIARVTCEGCALLARFNVPKSAARRSNKKLIHYHQLIKLSTHFIFPVSALLHSLNLAGCWLTHCRVQKSQMNSMTRLPSHVAGASNNLAIVEKSTAAQISCMTRQFPADTDVPFAGFETVDGAYIIQAAAGNVTAWRCIGTCHDPARP